MSDSGPRVAGQAAAHTATAIAANAAPRAEASADVLAARSAVARALGDVIDGQHVAAALQMWVQRFEGDDSLFFRLHRYCHELSKLHPLGGREAELNLRVLRLLEQAQPASAPNSARDAGAPNVAAPSTLPNTEPGALGPTRSAIRDARPSHPGRVSEPLALPPALQGQSARVLQTFYGALEAQLARELPTGVTPARVRRTLIRHAATLPRPQQHAASIWWSGQVSVLGGDWPAGGHGTALANVMYVALAELLGPAHADRCFTQAVLRLEASKDGALALIRRYL